VGRIRRKAMMIFKYKGKYLFTVCIEEEKNKIFYIPAGGGIEFGEHSRAAAKREVMEETNQEIENEKLVDISEHIFTFNGIDEHGIVFIYSAEFKDKSAYTTQIKGGFNSEGQEIKLVWAPLDEIQHNKIRVYPESLSEILSR
jgi:8-oxo-dGTP pyrophosphatase MutT (NUDIX family)